MRFLVIFRPGRQVAPKATDKAAYWRSCREYISEKQADGSLESYFWTNVLPAGLSAPHNMAAVGLLHVDTVEEAHAVLQGYPGMTTEEGFAFELIPMLNSEAGPHFADDNGFRYLAMGKPTLYKARPARDAEAFEELRRTYVEELAAAGAIEYIGMAHGPDQVKAYVFLNVKSHEELYAALRCYPGTAVQEGYQWQFHTLLDSEYCFNSMINEAKATAIAPGEARGR